MDVSVANTQAEYRFMENGSPMDFDQLKEVILDGTLEFDEWVSLILESEDLFSDDNEEKVSLVYDTFLSEFPLCHGYWKKYANLKARLCTGDKAVEIFEKAVQAATYSVEMWVDYCSFGVSIFEDPNDVRRLFKRGISFVGKDYLCHTLWDKYIEFEFSQQQWTFLAQLYIQTLKFPSKKLHYYYESLKKFAAMWRKEIDHHASLELKSESLLEIEVPIHDTDGDFFHVIKDLLDPSSGLVGSKALQKYMSIAERFYTDSCQLNEKIHCFERLIRRPYFHVKPLDTSQLKNWHDYLNFVEIHGDFDWAVKLYERCLIPCANYPEFWMRYVEFLETKGGRELANFALARATQVYLKKVPAIHLFSARFKELIGDVPSARTAVLQCEIESDLDFVENVITNANIERRLENFVGATSIYEEALEIATAMESLQILPILYVHFSRLKHKMTGNVDAARDVLVDGIKNVPHCKILLEELIKLVMMHGERKQIDVIDSIIAKEISPGSGDSQSFSAKDVEDISTLYIQFVDLCGSIHDVRMAWSRHIKLFPHCLRSMSYKLSASDINQVKIATGARKETLVHLPHKSCGDHGNNNLVHLPIQDKIPLPPETEGVADQRSYQEFPFLENHEVQSDKAKTDIHQSGQEKVQELSYENSEQPRKYQIDPSLSSLPSFNQVANKLKGLQGLQNSSKDSNVREENYHVSKPDQKPLSPETLNLDSRDDRCLVSNNKTVLSGKSVSKLKAQEASISNGSMPIDDQNTERAYPFSSPIGVRGSDAIVIHSGMRSPSPDSLPNSMKIEAHRRQQSPVHSGRNLYPRSYPNKVRRGSKFVSRGYSNRKLHQQRQEFRQQEGFSRTDCGVEMPMGQCYPSQPLSSGNLLDPQGNQVPSQIPAATVLVNQTTPQAWSMQYVQGPNHLSGFPQIPSQSVSYSEAQVSQYTIQSNEQHSHLQNKEAYNQMWQYYYYQQQYQQFLLQHQQHPQQQQQPQQQYQMQNYIQKEQLQQQPQQDVLLSQQPQQQQPLQDQVPSQQPLQEQFPSQQPQQEQFSSQQPQQEQFPSLQPQQEQFLSLQPQQEQLPSLQLQQAQIPFQDPHDEHLPSQSLQLQPLQQLHDQQNQSPQMQLQQNQQLLQQQQQQQLLQQQYQQMYQHQEQQQQYQQMYQQQEQQQQYQQMYQQQEQQQQYQQMYQQQQQMYQQPEQIQQQQMYQQQQMLQSYQQQQQQMLPPSQQQHLLYMHVQQMQPQPQQTQEQQLLHQILQPQAVQQQKHQEGQQSPSQMQKQVEEKEERDCRRVLQTSNSSCNEESMVGSGQHIPETQGQEISPSPAAGSPESNI